MPAPVGPLMALVMRILRVDGSRASLDASLFASQQASLRSELPALQISALELLSAALRGVRGYVPLSFLLPLVIALSLNFEVFVLHGRILSGRSSRKFASNYPSSKCRLIWPESGCELE